MRLIDADEYKKHLCEHCLTKLKHGGVFCPCGRVLGADYFPTAFDVDMCIEAIEGCEHVIVDGDIMISMNDAINVVKDGGIYETD